MKKGDKVMISEMGMMGLEDYYATVVEDLGNDFCKVDLGNPCILEGKIRIIHKSRITLL